MAGSGFSTMTSQCRGCARSGRAGPPARPSGGRTARRRSSPAALAAVAAGPRPGLPPRSGPRSAPASADRTLPPPSSTTTSAASVVCHSAYLIACQSKRRQRAGSPLDSGSMTHWASTSAAFVSPSQPGYRSSRWMTGAPSGVASSAASQVLPDPDRPSTAISRVRPSRGSVCARRRASSATVMAVSGRAPGYWPRRYWPQPEPGPGRPTGPRTWSPPPLLSGPSSRACPLARRPCPR